MNNFKKIAIEFINSEYIAEGAEDWIVSLMSGKPQLYSNVKNARKIIKELNKNPEYFGGNSGYKVIIRGLTATLVQFEDWEIVDISDDPWLSNEDWTYEAAKAEYEAEFEIEYDEA